MREKELCGILEKYKVPKPLNYRFITEEKDYFRQVVVIIGSMLESADNDLVESLDEFFATEGYNPGDFKRALQKYYQDVEDLYQASVNKTILEE